MSIVIVLSGCWDVVNLEDRAFIVGTAIDLIDDQADNEKQQEFKITNQMVIPAGTRGPSQNSGGDVEPYLNITTTGHSIFKVNKQITGKTSKVPFYEHLSVLIISEDLARKQHLVSKVLDTYIRNVNIRRGVKVIVTKGDPNSLLTYNTPEQKLPALHIEELLEHSSQESGFLTPIVIGDLEEFHLGEKSYILPLLEVNKEVEYKSGAIFHGPNDAMVGIFKEDEMKGMEILRGESVGKAIDFTYEDEIFALEIIRQRSKIKVDPKDINQIKVSINIDLQGIIKESFGNMALTKNDTIEYVQNAVSDAIKGFILNAIEKGQKEFNSDVFKIWSHLQQKHYNIWKKIEKDWEVGENYFANVTFDINVNSHIYSIGSTDKTD